MRDFLAIADLSRDQLVELLDMADALKKEWHASLKENRRQKPLLEGKTLAMYFEKPSLRTRCSFEAGMQHLGGYAINLDATQVGRLGERESISDLARNLARWNQVIEARVFSHESVLELAKWSDVPVVNGLSDFEHPTQIIADYQTIREIRGSLDSLRLAWIGDANNVSHSLMLMACKLGHEMTLAIPFHYQPGERIWALCEEANPKARDLVKVVIDPKEAVANADVLYTDVWTSMGQEGEARKREEAFANYQINDELVAAAPSHAFVLHDMPAKRGKEITDSVMDGRRCRAFDQAENRMHAIKAILCWCLGVAV